MTIDEAIRLQVLLCESSILDPIPMYKESSKLGIEALKFYQRLEIAAGEDFNRPLPGETPQIDNKRSLHHIKQILESNEVRK